jgi:phosphonoacetaldehyde hydrolase
MNPLPFKAVVLDWAGTVIDFGSLAPMGAFVELFRRHDIVLSVAEARIPMGLPKWDHIDALGKLPAVAAQWQRVHGRPFAASDVDALYEEFTPMNAASVVRHAELIPGALEVIAALREQGLKIGSTTGYNRPIMEVVQRLAADQGYVPDNLVCAGDTPQGRPTPLMMYRCFADLGVWPASAVVKVDDTEPGLAEGLAAGCWTVGVAVSGNAVGLSLAEWQSLDGSAQAVHRERATVALRRAGAHEVINTIADLPEALLRLATRAGRGELPVAG